MKSLVPLTALAFLTTLPCAACAAPETPVRSEAASITAQDLAGKRVMVLGDSITQAGGYVSFMDYLLQKEFAEKSFDFVSIGLASETTSGVSAPGHQPFGFAPPCVQEGLGRALGRVKPAVVIACYGMNDGIFQPLDAKRTAAFMAGITKLVSDCNKAGAKVILVSPPIFDTRAP